MVVLVVDSNPADLTETTQVIQNVYAGADVVTFDDGMEAVQYGFNHSVDAVYSAVTLPHLTGFDVARLLRSRNPDLTPFLFDDSEKYAGRARRERIDGFCQKPLTEETVRRFYAATMAAPSAARMKGRRHYRHESGGI